MRRYGGPSDFIVNQSPNPLILGLEIFDLAFLNEVVGYGKTVKRYLFAVVELGVVGWLVALVISLSTKVQILGF